MWGAFRLSGAIYHALHALWHLRGRTDEFIRHLVTAHLAQGGRARGVRAGEAYEDAGALHGYREAIRLLAGRQSANPNTAIGSPSAGSRSTAAASRRLEPPGTSHA